MRNKPSEQIYANYTAEDRLVWQLLFERQMRRLRDAASSLYLESVERIGFKAREIPDFEKVNERLSRLTGWRLQAVPDLVPDAAFFGLLARRVFPATCWLRTFDELDYLEEPDMFHDVFGHAPLLAHPAYADFMEEFGKLGLKWAGDAEAVAHLARLYWFTVEFGLIRENGADRVLGAGILSSVGETKHALSVKPLRLPFSLEAVRPVQYRTDVLQDVYFVAASLEQLRETLPQMDAWLAGRAAVAV